MLQTFFDRLPDHQIDIPKGSSYPTDVEKEVNSVVEALKIHMSYTCKDPTIMYNFKGSIPNVPSIDLTSEVPVIHYHPIQGNIAGGNTDNVDTSTASLSHHGRNALEVAVIIHSQSQLLKILKMVM